jgi:protein SCO1/2
MQALAMRGRSRCSGYPRRALLPIVLAVLVVAPALAGCSGRAPDNGAAVQQDDNGGFAGRAISVDLSLPDVDLTDTAGQAFDLATDVDRPVTVLFFGYTNCPDLCNAAMAAVASALRRVDPAVADDVQVVFVSVDPARDTPPVLRAYLDRFEFPSYVGLTGDLDTVEVAATAMHVPIDLSKEASGEVIHGTQIFGFGPDGKAHVFWTDGVAPADLAHDLTQLAEAA